MRRLPQLEILRLKILRTLRFSERYWMIYKEKTFGIATILDLIYKRLYIEILFFTNDDVNERGVPLIKIYTPTETRFDFNEIIVNPDIDKDGLVSPKKIMERVNKLIKKELKYHLAILDNEIQLIDEHFENSPVDGNPYFRKIRIYLPDLIIKFKINLENYPLEPKLMEKNQIIIEKYITTYIDRFKEILREKFRGVVRQKVKKLKFFIENLSINTDLIKSWDAEKPPHVFQIIRSLFNLKEGTQVVVLEKDLNSWGRPKESDESQGRFIVFQSGFLDTSIYRRDREITVAGEITGKKVLPIDEIEYTYPVLSPREIHLWSEEKKAEYPYWHDPWWGYYPYPYWRHPYRYPYRPWYP